MNERLCQVLENRPNNYILPFFWQHGECEALLREGMKRIQDSGIDAVCVESRPHPDFLGSKWWQDLDVIMDEAKRRDMKVWVLDDAHFPSGICNGKIDDTSPYGKEYLTHICIDVPGPLEGHAFMVSLSPGERLQGVIMGRIDRQMPGVLADLHDLTSMVSHGKVYADIPPGTWCIMVLKTTRRGSGRKNYINTIDQQAVRYFIDTVYEAHYAHYAQDFGKTFAGFFSDEPEIGNGAAEHDHHLRAGQPDINLPWCPELESILKDFWGSSYAKNLAALFAETDIPDSGHAAAIREQFTDHVASLYGRNFCQQIGDWCRAHGVEYIGHVIEDDGRHAQLGLGTAHYFRALWGQDMAGIDVVLQQLRPELDDYPFHSVGGINTYNGEFFHYGLACLGTSLAMLDPKKHGRTMCEVFGAYGWSEGLKQMKWILDHMMASGVNSFVPHAFTMKDFPDPDCPPHFYARGYNPQYPYFRNLMEYTNRVCHLISGGFARVQAAILYTAEQEWAGKVVQFEKPMRELTQAQISALVLPADSLLQAQVKNGVLYPVGGASSGIGISALVISSSTWIPALAADAVIRAATNGVRVYCFGDILPRILETDGTNKAFPEGIIHMCSMGELATCLQSDGFSEISLSEPSPRLRYYHYVRKEADYLLFFNEAAYNSLDTEVTHTFETEGAFWYDPWLNEIMSCEKGNTFHLTLAPYELKILVLEHTQPDDNLPLPPRHTQELVLPEQGWTIELCEAGEKGFHSIPATALCDLTHPDCYPFFSGKMRYTLSFDWSAHAAANACACANWIQLSLGKVYETASVSVNGVHAGVRVAPPYLFSVGRLLKPGRNQLEIIISNTLVHHMRDSLSMTMPLEPSGLIGPVSILF